MNDLWDQYRATEEASKREQEDRLQPTGTYEGQIQDWTEAVQDRAESPYHGHPMARIQVKLFDAPRPFPVYANLTPVEASDKTGRLLSPSKLAIQLARATGTIGETFDQTLKASKDLRLRFRVRLKPEQDGYPARNDIDAITKLRA